ncbi:polyprenyl synthetase family protein [Sporosarcina sp. HYO08]|uniref:polyprenyl synthetase family protein n=1 Tax=Sporosarcina sp. HYO08 TaxID=1759557 RepID=UPI00079135D2|nr:farnesyl diphosphate synthase [Sporosarcina sp. HYO08]KXH87488.1 farnesyl-diphosphate synthase [Sporosarcina sp. HYO08]
MHKELSKFINDNLPLIDEKLHTVLDGVNLSKTLKESMAYSINAGGKRIRPLLVLATLKDLQADSKDALAVAGAIELIHTYSLIHDDLPSMDDDDYRRGKLTNHKVFGEAVAVLAGDALQALAFQMLSELKETNPADALRLMHLLGTASGAAGMVGGQMLDLEGEQKKLSLSELEQIHIHKTGALLSFCIEAGAILAGLESEKAENLKEYAYHIGLAFQIQDDILDVTATTEQLGKTAGSDTASEKSTYPALLGLDGAQERLMAHHQSAKEALAFLEVETSLLALFADYIVERQS